MTTLAKCALPIATLAALLAACGGGGGGGGVPTLPPVIAPEPVVATIDVAAAWRNYVTAPHTWSMRGKGSDARAYELTVEMKPGPSDKFPMTGSTGQTTAQSLRFTVDGASTVSSDGTLYFTSDTMIGVATNDGACAGARGAMSPLPGPTAAGASGAMFVLDGYAGCTVLGQKLGSTVFKWSVQSDGALTMFCITSEQKNGEGTPIGNEVDCIEANTNGALGDRAKFTITRPDGNAITGRNY